MHRAPPPIYCWTDPPDPSLQRFDEIESYARERRMPWRIDSQRGQEHLASLHAGADGDKKIIRLPARLFENKIKSRFRNDLTNASVSALRRKIPSASAHALLSPKQRDVAVILIALFSIIFAATPLGLLIAFNIFVSLYFLCVISFRLYLAAIAWRTAPGADPSEKAGLADEALPTVTILLPLYDEAGSLALLSAAIDRLDYPADKIDVKLLLEEDDHETIAAAQRLGLDLKYDMIVLPPSEPRTKPKACNHALYLARGDLVVIYDAEDMPEADQLRKTAAVFAHAGDDVACVQARLNYYNAKENWLTRLFALEYALWFDSLLPALEKIRAPIPLGGTSNFFRTDILRRIGGWDPYNVTEDADLGMRLSRFGYRTSIVNSTTFEEANSQIGNWTRQRSRWMKGYLQTWLVHMREPVQFFKAAGWRGFLTTQLFLAGTVFSALINPVLWFVFLWWLATGSDAIASAFPGPLMAINIFILLFGNAAFIGLALIAPIKRGWTELCPYALLSPVYWWMTTFAAYKAVWQLLTRPHFWEKTDHILSPEAAEARAETLSKIAA
ncbi:MAG: glycosyltransferase family 2 protein [Pseudomonadota bacterium]